MAKEKDLENWLKEHRITEVECMAPDMAGIARGKILPTNKFLDNFRRQGLRLPESVFGLTVTGDSVESEVLTDMEPDVILLPDPSSVRIVPWYEEPTAEVICDVTYRDGRPVMISPRYILRHMLELYKAEGWTPVVAPELEFYLAKKNVDPDYPLEPPVGKSGRAERGRQAYGIDAVNEFDPIFEDMYAYCEAQELDVDTLIHESGAAQVEINFNHGDPLDLADQVFLFKRTVRNVALQHDVYATFMAKPFESEPGSAMHIHQSIEDSKGKNIFATPRTGKDTKLFLSYIAGLQRYLPAAMAFFAPYVNSYRRVVRDWAAPVNTHWGHENRTVGLRVPASSAAARRVENRVPGADANPYLALAATLACGYLGMKEGLTPTKAMEGNAYASARYPLPRHLLDALAKLRAGTEFRDLFGPDFVTLFLDIKNTEHDAYQQVISPWEREHLLLNV